MEKYEVHMEKPNKGKVRVCVDLYGKGEGDSKPKYLDDIKGTVEYLVKTVFPFIRKKLLKRIELIGGLSIVDDPIADYLSTLNNEIVRTQPPLKPEGNLEKVVREQPLKTSEESKKEGSTEEEKFLEFLRSSEEES